MVKSFKSRAHPLDQAGNKLEAAHAHSPQALDFQLTQTSTNHLKQLHDYNMGYSGASEHGLIPHIRKRLIDRGHPVPSKGYYGKD